MTGPGEITHSNAERSSWAECAGVLALMAALTVVMTWPLVLKLSTAVNDFGDPLLNAFILWWDNHALTDPGASLWDAPMFHPHRLTLAYSEHMIVSALTAAPVFWAGGGAILAHNLVFCFSFVFAGLGAYLLGRELTGSRAGGLICGLAFAFSPFRFGHLGHLQNMTAHFMPWMFLYLHRWVRSPRWSWALGAGAFWLLQVLSCGYYAYFISLGAGVFLIFYAIKDRLWANRRLWTQLGTVFLAAALLAAPFFLPYLKAKSTLDLVRSHLRISQFSARPQSYLAAPPANRIYGQATQRFRKNEGELFLGVGLSALVLLGLLTPGKGPPVSRGRLRAAMIMLAHGVGFAIIGAMEILSGGLELSLGPLGHTLDSPSKAFTLSAIALTLWRITRLGGVRAVWTAGLARTLGLSPDPGGGARPRLKGEQVFYLLLAVLAAWASLGPDYGLYALLLQIVPGLDSLRAPARLAVLVTLAWAVLGAYGLAVVQRCLDWRPLTAKIAVLVFGLLILAEALSVPMSWERVYAHTPPVYEYVKQLPPDSVIAEVPAQGFRNDFSRDARYLYWATKHHKKLFNGYSGHFPPEYAEMARLANRLFDYTGFVKLWQQGVTHVVVHFKEFPKWRRPLLLRDMKEKFSLKVVYQDGLDYVFDLSTFSYGKFPKLPPRIYSPQGRRLRP